jgi:hypothetical protein
MTEHKRTSLDDAPTSSHKGGEGSGANKAKIVVIVLCLAGAGAGLYYAFGPKPAPKLTTGGENIPQTDDGSGADDGAEEVPTAGA